MISLQPSVSETHLIRLTFQATWSLANTPIVVFITVIFFPIVFSCSVLCKFCVCFFSFSIQRAAVSVFFHLAILFRFYRVLFLHHVSEQIKMMMMMIMHPVIPDRIGRAKGVPFASGVFLRRLRGSWAPHISNFRLWEMPAYVHNATTRRVRSEPTRAQNASLRARICLLGPERCSPTFRSQTPKNLNFWHKYDFQT